jgi:hypothetical protein
MKKPAKEPRYPHSKAQKSSQPISDQISCSSRIYNIRIRIRGTFILADLLSHALVIRYFGSKRLFLTFELL